MFLIILKVRNRTSHSEDEEGDLDAPVVKKLVELQLYLEKGVRPLESRLKYQIDKVLRAADDARRAIVAAKPKADTKSIDQDDYEESDVEAANGVALKASEIDDLQYRPNPSSFNRPSNTAADSDTHGSRDGFYKPPRIQAATMPTTGPRDKEAKRANKSATLDEFVTMELSSAPSAEPSIGSTIVAGGRRSKSEKERKEDAEKREYEESHFVRLPKESKKERLKKPRKRDAGYGGEEWRGLGEGIDRIERLTKRQGGARGALEKSRKRATEDGPRASGGVEAGKGFQKRLKALDGGRRDRGRKRLLD